MTRRELLQALLTAGIWTVFEDFALAAQAASMKDIQELQKNWRALLADGIKVPLASEPLKLSKDEWRNLLRPVLMQPTGSASFIRLDPTLKNDRCKMTGIDSQFSAFLP